MALSQMLGPLSIRPQVLAVALGLVLLAWSSGAAGASIGDDAASGEGLQQQQQEKKEEGSSPAEIVVLDDPDSEAPLPSSLPQEQASRLTQDEPEVADWGWSKWLLWPVIVYFFWAQSLICDEYFVPAVQGCAETCHIPEDVAGATIMALGCNGPELFVNVIALFITHSTIGVGTIVGSNVFNLLLICAFSALFSPAGSLQLDGAKLTRDLLFYAVSIGLLYWAIKDGKVELHEALVLSSGVAFFGGTVAAWSRLVRCLCAGARDISSASEAPVPLVAAADGARGVDAAASSEAVAAAAAGKAAAAALSAAEFAAQLSSGLWLQVRPGDEMGRLQSRCRPYARRLVCMDAEGCITLQREESRRMRTASAPPLGTLEDGGLLHQPTETADLAVGDILGRMTIAPRDVKEVVAVTTPGAAEFRLVCAPQKAGAGVGGGLWGAFPDRERPVSWEFQAKNGQERDLWVAALSGGLRQAIAQGEENEIAAGPAAHGEEARSKSCSEYLWAVIKWFCFPVEISLELTVPECTGSHRQRWPITFLLSMVWLAVFSYLLCSVVDLINQQYGISNTLLGLTLTAAGTSFPNLFASILVAKRGQSSMAVANAVGSNVQNVFLALGWPWVVKALVSPNMEFEQQSQGIVEGVVWMAGTLVQVAILLLVGRCGLGAVGAWVLILTYASFTIYAIIFDH